jgi:hypothetical protein
MNRHTEPRTRRYLDMRAVLIVLVTASGCLPETPTIRTGKSLPSAVGASQNGCENAEMLEIVPARTFARDDQYAGGWGGYNYYTHTEESQQGFALYRRDGRGPLPLVETLPALREPELETLHLQRLEPFERRQAKMKVAQKIAIVGLAALLAGTGFMTHAALTDSGDMINSNELLLGAALMGGGAIVGGGGAIAALVFRPTGLEHTYHDLRSHVLVPGEDDTDAAVRGVDRYNEQVRARCH